MQMRAIESFLALYEDRSFSKASRRLFITQQGLSRQIQALEKELGKLLFERSHLGAEPTETAHLLYPYYQQIFEIYRASEELLTPTEQRTIRVGFAFGISSAGDPDFLIDFQRLHPEILVEIQEWSKAECIRKLLHNQLDVAFLINPFPETLFRTCRITSDHMYAAMHKTHPLAADVGPLDFHALDRQMLLTGSPENALRQFFDYCCVMAQIHPHIRLASSHNLDVVNTMGEDMGIATLNSAMALRVTNPNIRIRRLELPCAGYLYGCVPLYCAEESLPVQVIRYAQDHYARHPVPVYPDRLE
ncbi:LysR family transcriptional regulator [uncultured Ruthenibacterium sp.]|uniref:LysR family transcriptional regulator n=1 Tax=uncultured Ruthenibacterium sp. TaxID=1905347 RepID=UPI00349E7086